MKIRLSNIISFVLIIFLAACSTTMGGRTAWKEPKIEYDNKDFNRFVASLRDEAAKKGIGKPTIEAALGDVGFMPRVIELDRKQPEKIKTFNEYISSVLTNKRKSDARDYYRENTELLKKVGSQYGVDPEVIVALWGMESNFGRNTGNFAIVPALVTLAYEGRRAGFWHSELFNALKIIDQGNISAGGMKGSWAGAMGQNQFMPSTFLSYAVDQNGDGRKDIWNSKADVFGSIANYLHGLGWKRGQEICEKVSLPQGFDLSAADIKNNRPISYWQKKGIEAKHKNGEASLINLEEDKANVISGGQYYLVYDNYKRIMKWNRSLYFATSICLLEGAI